MRAVETAWRGMSIDGVGYDLYRVRRTLREMLKDRGYSWRAALLLTLIATARFRISS